MSDFLMPMSNFVCYSLSAVKMQGRMDRLFSILGKQTSEPFRQELLKLCENYLDIFALEDESVSVNNFYTQRLAMKDNEPVYIRQYKQPPALRSEIDKQVEKLIRDDIIEPSVSPYNNPILLVPKKSDSDKKWRLVVDFRKLNEKLIPDKFPIPRIDDIFDQLAQARFFSVIDLSSGFHQIELEQESRKYTSISTPRGQFQYKRLPFGLNVAPNSFSRMMSIAFSAAIPDRAFLYLDDLICVSPTVSSHFDNLRFLFDICRKRNLKLNPNKSHFFQEEVTYLGHRLTRDGIKPDPSKDETIRDYPVPTSADECKRFVAFCNYYRKFIENFSLIVKPLNALMKKNVPFIWTLECETSFRLLKSKLLNPPVLMYPNFKKPFILTTDASKHGCGACLSQVDTSGDERAICFASRVFTQGERNKPVMEQELCALHWAVVHFRPYLYGNNFWQEQTIAQLLSYTI